MLRGGGDRPPARPASQIGQASLLPKAAEGGRGQAGKTLVTPADRRLVAGGIPRRSGDACEPRDDLHVVVRPGTRSPAPRALPLPTPRTGHSSPQGNPPAHGQGGDQRRSEERRV